MSDEITPSVARKLGIAILKVAKNPQQRTPTGFRETNAMHIGGGTWLIRYEPVADAKVQKIR